VTEVGAGGCRDCSRSRNLDRITLFREWHLTETDSGGCRECSRSRREVDSFSEREREGFDWNRSWRVP